MKNNLMILLASFIVVTSATGALAENQGDKVEVYFFWGQGCPHCAEMKPLLQKLEDKYPQLEVKSFEVYYNKSNLALLKRMIEAYGEESKSIPVTFIGETMIEGYLKPYTDERLEELINECITEGCISPEEKLQEYINNKTTTNAINLNDSLSLEYPTVVYFFWGQGCPHCAHEKPFLEKMQEKYPLLDVREYEVWYDNKNAQYFRKMAEAYGVKATGVPMTFIGDFQPTIGFGGETTTGKILEEKIVYCLKNGCIDPADKIKERNQSTINNRTLCIHFFFRSDCTQCRGILPKIKDIAEKYNVEVVEHNVSIPKEKELYELFKETYSIEHGAYPIAFVGNYFFIGDKAISENLENSVVNCLQETCPCPTEKIRGFTPYLPKSGETTPEENRIIEVPLLGEVNLNTMSLYSVTVIISFIDGINPCSLWVLTFLLTIALYSKSRFRVIVVGLVFLTIAALAYGLFIAGILNIFLYMGQLFLIRLMVAVIALTFAAVNIKDYFWYKKGISFTIADEHKSGIMKKIRGIRRLMESDKPIMPMIIATAALSLGVTLVELPCTIGLPVLWTSIIAEKNVDTLTYVLLLLIYLIIYALDELIVFIAVVYSMKALRLQEKHGRGLKLFSGMIMLTLGAVMFANPELMSDVFSSSLVFAAAVAATAVVLFVHRRILPKYGIIIGSEKLVEKKDTE